MRYRSRVAKLPRFGRNLGLAALIAACALSPTSGGQVRAMSPDIRTGETLRGLQDLWMEGVFVVRPPIAWSTSRLVRRGSVILAVDGTPATAVSWSRIADGRRHAISAWGGKSLQHYQWRTRGGRRGSLRDKPRVVALRELTCGVSLSDGATWPFGYTYENIPRAGGLLVADDRPTLVVASVLPHGVDVERASIDLEDRIRRHIDVSKTTLNRELAVVVGVLASADEIKNGGSWHRVDLGLSNSRRPDLGVVGGGEVTGMFSPDGYGQVVIYLIDESGIVRWSSGWRSAGVLNGKESSTGHLARVIEFADSLLDGRCPRKLRDVW